MATLTPVYDNDTLVIFLREVSEQQNSILNTYRTAYDLLEDLRVRAMMHGMLTEDEITKRQNLENMKLFCTRIMGMLNNLWYFASKELV